jgi:hypothetical protein
MDSTKRKVNMKFRKMCSDLINAALHAQEYTQHTHMQLLPDLYLRSVQPSRIYPMQVIMIKLYIYIYRQTQLFIKTVNKLNYNK